MTDEIEKSRLIVRVHTLRGEGKPFEAAKVAAVLADNFSDLGDELYTPYWRGVTYGLLMACGDKHRKDPSFLTMLEVARAHEMVYAAEEGR